MTRLLDGLTAFVTGGGSGIGRATAIAMAEEGARVAVTDIDLAAAEATVAMIAAAQSAAASASANNTGSNTGSAYAARLDVTDAAACKAVVDDLVARWGRLDCAFNNAGVSLEGLETSWGEAESFARTFAINVTGVLNCMTAELAHMVPAQSGAIVNTSSIAGLSGIAGAGYCGAKHAVVGLTKSAALRHATQGIRVNAVCPGAITTPMTDEVVKHPTGAALLAQMHPMGRMGEAREIADAVVFLCSSRASFITGHPLPVDGGFTAR